MTDLGYYVHMCHDFVGAAVVTVLRNPLSTSGIRKAVLVPVRGNIAAPKFVEDIFALVVARGWPVTEVGSLLGASNAA